MASQSPEKVGHGADLQLVPELLGAYWPVRGEFNPCPELEATTAPKLRLALPYSQREPRAMHYRAWDGALPSAVDECGIPAPADGPAVVPDVVLVPCVGFTRSGWRLGYGGGYFDRWLAQHPQVAAVGVAWWGSQIGAEDWVTEAHDQPLGIIVTERGVVA